MTPEEDESTTSLLHNSTPITKPSTPGSIILINVYDLLPVGCLADCLWRIGAGITHSGVVIQDKEWSYGAHQQPGTTGVFYTSPGSVPPGGTFRHQIVQGMCYLNDEEVSICAGGAFLQITFERLPGSVMGFLARFAKLFTIQIYSIMDEAREKFLGAEWSLLRNNCNHFTTHVCRRLTGKAAPSYLNRAASVAVALHCFFPETMIEAPEAENVDPLLPIQDQDANIDDRDTEDREGLLEENIELDLDDYSDHDVELMSEGFDTDDSHRARWRRRRRQYKSQLWRPPSPLFDDEGRPISKVMDRPPVTAVM